MRSTVNDSDLLDNEAVQLETTNQKCLSRCHWEDIIGYAQGQKLVFYVCNDVDLTTNVFNNMQTHSACDSEFVETYEQFTAC